MRKHGFTFYVNWVLILFFLTNMIIKYDWYNPYRNGILLTLSLSMLVDEILKDKK